MRKTITVILMSLAVLGLLSSRLVSPETAAQEDSVVGKKPPVPGPTIPDGMTLPEYNEHGELLRPMGYERWTVVGTSIGLSYSDGEAKNPDDPGQFHNVYMQPEAFDHYVRTGEFPEQTIFVVTNNPSTSTKGKDSLNRHGFFAAPSAGLEVAVRDSKRFPDAWAYFLYHGTEQKPAVETPPSGTKPVKTRPAEAAYPRAACYDCHAEHGAVDNVFTQFYSVLSQARAQRVAENRTADK